MTREEYKEKLSELRTWRNMIDSCESDIKDYKIKIAEIERRMSEYYGIEMELHREVMSGLQYPFDEEKGEHK